MKEIKELLEITQKLRDKYIHLNKKFSLDGKLVGDIGEVLAAEEYGIILYDENTPIHDGYEESTGRKVQIKASFKNNSYFPSREEFIPEYFLSLNIAEDGTLEEIYNGPGRLVWDKYIKEGNLKPDTTGYNLSSNKLKGISGTVPVFEKIQRLGK